MQADSGPAGDGAAAFEDHALGSGCDAGALVGHRRHGAAVAVLDRRRDGPGAVMERVVDEHVERLADRAA
jgi:hypothetical protein